MSIGVVGTGPAREAIRGALSDVGARVAVSSVDEVGVVDFAIVIGPTGDSVFERASRTALDARTSWLAVELGGVGGHPLEAVEASVSGFAPETGCHACLRTRVASNLTDGFDSTRSPSESDASTARLAGALAGREAVSLLRGASSAILGGVVELPYAVRSFLPVPNCPVCGDSVDGCLTREHAERSLEEALDRAERGLDERVGIVRSIGELDSFPAPYYLAETCDTSEFSDATAPDKAAGVAADWNTALMKGLGEALERYSAGVYRESSFTVAPPADLTEAVSPERFVRPSDVTFDPARPIPWTPGEHLTTGEAVLLPAEFVHFPPPEERFKPSITTGLGLGNSPIEALYSGLCEVLERDATMLAWYSTFEPLGLSVDDDEFRTLTRRARGEGLAVTPTLSTQDVDVPVVTVAVHREDEWPRFAVGSGTDLDADAAARSALAEALQNWMELRMIGREDAGDQAGAIGHYADFPATARRLIDVDTSVPSDSVGPARLPDGSAKLDALLERTTDAGLDTYATRITPRDVETLGFEAVRVVVPGAQPLFTDAAFFGERARSVPSTLGFESKLDAEMHPYP